MNYLPLETFYHQKYNHLNQKYNEGKIDIFNVYEKESPADKIEIFYQIRSKSVCPFSGLLMVVAVAIGYFLAYENNCFKV
jgi:hypothetical protein